jgi:hypothetical protein
MFNARLDILNCKNLINYISVSGGIMETELVDKIISYENDTLSEAEEIELFQHLVNTGMAWSLQGHYGRVARRMLEEGLITQGE